MSSNAPLGGSPWSDPGMVAGFAQSATNAVLMKFGEDELGRTGSRRTLDLGRGAGRNVRPLARLGWNVVGRDLFPAEGNGMTGAAGWYSPILRS